MTTERLVYLDTDRLAAIDPAAFRARTPYPWVSPEGVLTEDGYARLRETLPELALFERRFGEQRKHGQKSHDRYVLEYRPDLPLAEPWRDFIGELESETYRAFLRAMIGRDFRLRFHWHYTPNGCSVSPHCDAKEKLGSHLFYFNTAADWDPAWGGETLILDDKGRFSRRSNPDFAAFPHAIAAPSLGNTSLLFCRRGASWHGVQEIRCPEGALRKVFIVVIDAVPLRLRLRRLAPWGDAAAA
jgi:hypothetical protein